MIPPATIPIDGLLTSATMTAMPSPDDGRDQLPPARDEPDGEADHRGREDDVDAQPAGLRDLRTEGPRRRASPGSTG
jgi:hypothetical protein